MRTVAIVPTILALMTVAPGLAQDVDKSDIPSQCEIVCSNLPTVTNQCDRAFRNDSAELNCICQATAAQLVIPLCAACVTQYDDDDDDDNDVSDLVSSCSFSTTTFDPSITYSMAQMTAQTSGADQQTILTGSASSVSITNTRSIISSATAVASSIASSLSDQASSATSAAGSQTTDNSAPGKQSNAKGVSALAGAALLVAAAWV